MTFQVVECRRRRIKQISPDAIFLRQYLGGVPIECLGGHQRFVRASHCNYSEREANGYRRDEQVSSCDHNEPHSIKGATETRRCGEAAMRGSGDAEMRRCGDAEMRRCGDVAF